MTKKKISILSLVILFLISTTGLPIWSHYCEMMGKRTNNGCEMCKAEIEKVYSDCCFEEVSENNLILTGETGSCCIQEFDFKKINDDYSQTFSSKLNKVSIGCVTLHSSALNSDKTRTNSQQINYNLPPPKFGKHLLFTIHQLKLELPVC